MPITLTSATSDMHGSFKFGFLPMFSMLMYSTYTEVAAQEGPGIVIARPGQNIELLCNVTGGVATWSINNMTHRLNDILNGEPPGHSTTGNNIIVQDIVMDDDRNGSIYVCLIPQVPPTPDITSDPTVLYVAGVPTMVPGVTLDNTININGDNVTLTLSWGEPFNNLDPIVSYTVSCSGDVTCPPNFTTTDNTTRSYTITNLTPMINYTFSVVATNSIGSGEAGVLMITTLPAIGQVTQVTLTCEPVKLMSQCTVTWEPVMQGGVTGYQVYYNGTLINVDNSTTMLSFTAPSLPNGVFTGTVVLTVAATSRLGVGSTGDPVSALIVVPSSVINATPMLVCTPAVSELYNITVTCTIHPDSTADQCVVMAMADGRVTRTGNASITERMATVTISDLQCGVTYNITAEGILNERPVGPGSSHGNITSGPCPMPSPMSCPKPSTAVDDTDKQDDEFSTGAAVAISIVVTFIITLVVTALISVFITSLYYKYRYELKEKITVDDDNTKQKDPYGGNIIMDTNPAYATTATIKMDTNPAYVTTTTSY